MNALHHYLRMPSPLGELLLMTDGRALTAVNLPPHPALPPDRAAQTGQFAVLDQAREQLSAYFAGALQQFDLPLAAAGTAFQQRVWAALRTIPFGTTWNYAMLAARIGNPKAARAVGLANGRNPLAIIVPCHRVIGANGSLTGYAGGLPRKQWLLAHESPRAGTAAVEFALD